MRVVGESPLLFKERNKMRVFHKEAVKLNPLGMNSNIFVQGTTEQEDWISYFIDNLGNICDIELMETPVERYPRVPQELPEHVNEQMDRIHDKVLSCVEYGNIQPIIEEGLTDIYMNVIMSMNTNCPICRSPKIENLYDNKWQCSECYHEYRDGQEMCCPDTFYDQVDAGVIPCPTCRLKALRLDELEY